jgi:hypothetical protein
LQLDLRAMPFFHHHCTPSSAEKMLISRNYLLALQYDMPAESSPADLVSVSRITFPSLVRNNFKRVIKRQSRPSPARLASRIELTEMLKANF